MPENKNIIKNYKYYIHVAVVFSFISLLIVTLRLFGVSHSFFDGLAISFLGIAALITFIFFRKRKDPDFKTELYIKDKDERLLQMRYKRNSRMSAIMIFEIAILLGVSVFYDLSFKVGGGILIYSHLLIGLMFTIIDRRKQNG